MMLSPILQICPLQFKIKLDWSIIRTGGANMDGFGPWIEYDIPVYFVKPPAPVYVLSIYEKVFVQQPHLVQRFPPNHPETSAQYVDTFYAVMIPIIHKRPGKET